MIISFTDILLLPLLALFAYKSTINLSFKASTITFFTFGILLYMYLFFIDTGDLIMYGIGYYLVPPIFYVVLSYIVFFEIKKVSTPIQTLSISFLFIWLLKDFWELPCYFEGIVNSTWQTVLLPYEYIFFSIFCIVIMWYLLRPSHKKIFILIIGIIVLCSIHFLFYKYMYSFVGYYGSEVYYMFSRIVGAIILYKTFITNGDIDEQK